MEIKPKNLELNSHTIALSKGTISTKKCWFFTKNANIGKIKRTLVLKGTFSETEYGCVLTCQILRF